VRRDRLIGASALRSFAGVVDVTVRTETEADIDDELDVLESVGAEGRWLGLEVPFDRAARADRIRDDLRHPEAYGAFVAETGGKVIGFIGLRLAPYGVASIAMAILSGFRGEGIGTRLVERGIAWAKDAGAHKLALEVWPHNEAAIALYKKVGFTEEGRLRRHYRRRNGQLWDALVMGMPLQPT
jgi:RimJ/RimL family protein N-acetyltransferase